MSQNIHQVFLANPITTNQNLDLMYFGRSPYGAGDDTAMTFANFKAQFLTPSSGVSSITGTANQVLANGLSASPQVGAVTLTLPQSIATSSTPTFAGVTAGNINIAANSIISTNSNGAINIVPNGSGATQGVVRIGTTADEVPPSNGPLQISAVQKASAIEMTTYWNANAGSYIYLSTSRSEVPGVKGAVTNPQILGSFVTEGDDGVTGLVAGAQIVARTSGAISSGVIPSQWEFYTANTSGTLTLGMTITNAQAVNLPGNLQVTGTITPSQTNGIVGTTTNNNANAGSVGEVISSQVLFASSISMTSGAALNVTSIALTAGDWDVYGNMDFLGGVSTVVNYLNGAISTVSATLPDPSLYSIVNYQPPVVLYTTQVDVAFVVPTRRISLSAPATVYLVAIAAFTTSTNNVCGQIFARRAR